MPNKRDSPLHILTRPQVREYLHLQEVLDILRHTLPVKNTGRGSLVCWIERAFYVVEKHDSRTRLD